MLALISTSPAYGASAAVLSAYAWFVLAFRLRKGTPRLRLLWTLVATVLVTVGTVLLWTHIH